MVPGSLVPPLRIGTAGWAIPRAHAGSLPPDGSSLARYAARFDAAEINSSFHRPHRPATYARWAASVPDTFRFAVKIPKTITHQKRLVGAEPELDRFLDEASALGAKMGPLLVQLPPSFAFDAATAESFLRLLRDRVAGPIACEPRHPTWFAPDADRLLADHTIARVAADPARVPEASQPGGWRGLVYYRLHGSPVMYRSSYEPAFLAALAARLAQREAETWCIFDNTTLGAAAGNALEVAHLASKRA